jgi:hypothetical protein
MSDDRDIKADPDDPTKFYRIVDGVRHDFQCGPGTYFHEELQTCVHPWQLPVGHPVRDEPPKDP